MEDWQLIKTAEDVLTKLKNGADHSGMSVEQRRAQRRSWVRGEMMLAHPEMAADQVNSILDRLDV